MKDGLDIRAGQRVITQAGGEGVVVKVMSLSYNGDLKCLVKIDKTGGKGWLPARDLMVLDEYEELALKASKRPEGLRAARRTPRPEYEDWGDF